MADVRATHPLAQFAVVLVLLLAFAVFFLSFVIAPALILGGYIAWALINERRKK